MIGLTPLALAFTLACVPAYRPPAPFVPLLEEQGDAQIAAQLGLGGAQLDAAVATSDLVSIRGGAQVAGFASEGHYAVGRVGAGVYGGFDDGGRWGVSVEGGGGVTRGVGNLLEGNDTTTTSTSTSTSSTTSTTGTLSLFESKTVQSSGPLLVVAIRPEAGFEGKVASIVLVPALAYHVLFHDDDSHGSGAASGGTLEPTAVVRLGGGDAVIGAQTWFGVALPFATSGVENIPAPLNVGVGLTVDLSREAASSEPP